MNTQALKLPPANLPPVGNQAQTMMKDRVYRTALSNADYLKLEQDGSTRGLKPYSYTKIIMTNFLSGECVLLSELPEKTADEIRVYMAKKRQHAAKTEENN